MSISLSISDTFILHAGDPYCQKKKSFLQNVPLVLVLDHVKETLTNAISFLESCESKNVLPT